jgi:signal transduction histidine kinase
MNYERILKSLAGVVIALTLLTATFSAAFFLTSFIFKTLVQPPQALLAEIVNLLLGILLFSLIGTGLSRFFRSRHAADEMRVFGPIFNALENISKGDFSVRLDDNLRDTVILRDTVVRELVKSVNHMALELNQMESMRQEFISNVSHEIQSPLTSIRGFAEALRNDHLSTAERTHYLSIIETESTRLSRITDNLLRLASLESAQIKFEPKPYRLDKQIRNLILAGEPQWTDKGIDLDVSLDEVVITADEDLLSQVWINLIHNSIKFTPEGGRIHVALCRPGRVVVVRISDTGIGIPEEDQPRIFERFYKADKSRRRSTEGSGLGLSIARKIVEMHKGTIGLESKLGAGTTLTVSLPVE